MHSTIFLILLAVHLLDIYPCKLLRASCSSRLARPDGLSMKILQAQKPYSRTCIGVADVQQPAASGELLCEPLQ